MVVNVLTPSPVPIVLDCGHVAAERERFRDHPGVRDFWCSFCAQWRRKRSDVALDQQTVPADHRVERAREILADHGDGWHATYDTDNGCTYPGCEDAFWLVSRLAESEPG